MLPHKDSKIPHVLKRWLVENKRAVIISSFVSIGFVLLLLVVLLSSRAGSAPLSEGRVPKKVEGGGKLIWKTSLSQELGVSGVLGLNVRAR